MKKLLDAHAKTADEREALSARLEKEGSERRKIEKTKGMLLGKLQAMEAKLIQVKDSMPGDDYPSSTACSRIWAMNRCGKGRGSVHMFGMPYLFYP